MRGLDCSRRHFDQEIIVLCVRWYPVRALQRHHVATPDGRLSEYLSGIDYPTRDVRLALVNASDRKIATVKDLVLVYCCDYVPSSGRYTVAILRLLAFAAMVMLIGMAVGFYLLARGRGTPHNGATA
jgi:hypothetical protein